LRLKDNINTTRDSSCPISRGTDPDKLFMPRSSLVSIPNRRRNETREFVTSYLDRCFKVPIKAGIKSVRLFSLKRKSMSLFIFPIKEGMEAESLFFERWKVDKGSSQFVYLDLATDHFLAVE